MRGAATRVLRLTCPLLKSWIPCAHSRRFLRTSYATTSKSSTYATSQATSPANKASLPTTTGKAKIDIADDLQAELLLLAATLTGREGARGMLEGLLARKASREGFSAKMWPCNMCQVFDDWEKEIRGLLDWLQANSILVLWSGSQG